MRSIVFSLTLALGAGLAGFALGGRHGFEAGYAVSNHANEVLTGGLAIHSLSDSASCEDAREALEFNIDLAIIAEDSYGERLRRPFYAPKEAYEMNLEAVLVRLSEYRRANPREHSRASDAVDRGLAKYAPSP